MRSRISSHLSFPADPKATTLSDMITAPQLRIIRAIGREAGIDTDEECGAVMGCLVIELSDTAAAALIDHLHHKPAGREVSDAISGADS